MNIDKHPLIRQAYEVLGAIEDCGASEALTNASCKAGDLMKGLGEYIDEKEEEVRVLRNEIRGVVPMDLRTCPLEEWIERRGLSRLKDDFATSLEMSGGVTEEDIYGTLRCLFMSLRQAAGELGVRQAGQAGDAHTIVVCNDRTAGWPEIEKVYQEFWKLLVEDEQGRLNVTQLKAELFDYHTMMDTVPEVYCEVTGGSVSKPLTDAKAVIGEYERVLEDRIQEAKEDWMLEHGIKMPVPAAPDDMLPGPGAGDGEN